MGGKPLLDWNYSACAEITQNLLNPTNLEEALRDWHAEKSKDGFAQRPRDSVGLCRFKVFHPNSLLISLNNDYQELLNATGL